MARKKVLTHQLADLYFDETTSYFEERWKLATKDTTDEIYKKYQNEKIEVSKKCLPKLFICDTRNFLFIFSTEMQEWTDEVVMNFWDSTPLEKLAFIASKELVSQMSIELSMEENTHKYPIRYFETEEEAKAWLLE